VAPGRELLIAVATGDAVVLWRPDAGLVALLDGLRGDVGSLSFNPDGSMLATGNGDGSVDVWQVADAEQRWHLWMHRDEVTWLEFSRDGKNLLSTSSDASAAIWSVDDGKLITDFNRHSAAIEVGRFSPDGSRVVTGGRDGSAKLWNAASGALIASLDEHAGPVSSAAFSPDGALVATAGDERTVKIWDAASGRLIRSLPSQAGPILAIAFNPRGDVLATAAKDSVARLWQLAPESRSREAVAALLQERSPLRISDGRLVLRGQARAGTGDEAGQVGAGRKVNGANVPSSPEQTLARFLAALAERKPADLQLLIAVNADPRLVELKRRSAAELEDLRSMLMDAKAGTPLYRRDGSAAYVAVEIAGGRIDAFLERETGQWKLVNLRARPHRVSGWVRPEGGVADQSQRRDHDETSTF
jgi:hypothetical protein